MSKLELEQVLEILQRLPEAQQRAVVEYLKELGAQSQPAEAESSADESALTRKGNVLVHTGVPFGSVEDIVAQCREERIQALIRGSSEG